MNPLPLELADQRAWADMYAAVPPPFAEAVGLRAVEIGRLPLFQCARIPFIHFNAVGSSFGLEGVAETELDAIATSYRDARAKQHWVHTIPSTSSPSLVAALDARGYGETSRWDRVYRRPAPAPTAIRSARDITVERVSARDATEWAGFIDRVYGLPTSPWLLALVGRTGWHHYAAREAGRIVAVRTLYVAEGWGWLGIDAPVPGLMTSDFEPDRHLCAAVVGDLALLGCEHLVTDVEAPTPSRSGPAYDGFIELGFEVAYTRVNRVSPA